MITALTNPAAAALSQVDDHTRDQAVRVFSAAVVGPALMFAGAHYPGTFRSKAALIGLGALMSGVNYYLFRKELEGSVVQEAPIPDEAAYPLSI